MSNSFREQLVVLKELQDIDLNLHRFDQVLKGLPERVLEVKTAYESKLAEKNLAQQELNSLQSAKKEDETGVEESSQYLREREAKLYAIKTNKEYQAALKEISDGKRLNREREDRILQYMEKIEELAKKCEQLSAETAEKESAYAKAMSEAQAETANIRAQMKEFEVKRPELAAKVDKVWMRKYDFIRKRYVLALAAVKDGACQGCLRRIPPQMYNEMLRFNEQKVCPSCQRLLFIEEQASAGEDENANQAEQK